MLWNMLKNKVLPKESNLGNQMTPSKIAPINSIVNVRRKIEPTSLPLCNMLSPRFSLMKFCWRIPNPPLRIANKAANEMMFSPPNCMSIITIICPLKLRTVEISIKLNPVTQLALILVNNAVTKSKDPLPAFISGSINKPVPKAINSMKLIKSNAGGVRLKSGSRSPTFPNSKNTIIIT